MDELKKMMAVLYNGKKVGEHENQGSNEANHAAGLAILAAAGLKPTGKAPQLTALGQARSFRQTAQFILKIGFSRSPFNPYLAAPLAVNAAFCIEVYLKALAETHGQKAHGHKLADLFTALPDATRAAIRTGFDTQRAKYKRDGGDLEAVLVEMNTAFQDWRYVYEGEKSFGFDVVSAAALIEALEGVAGASESK